jgi:GR25 family glycosyltransferase involved in LPS biosynthesis
MGGHRQEAIERMFETLSDDFESPVFSPGVPARNLRSRSEFFRTAHETGLLPLDEWDALEQGFQDPLYQEHPERFFECLRNVPIAKTSDRRKGSKFDLEQHYSVELWRKSKTINRGRSVLACLLAHLLAMNRLVEEDFDMILEDNVRLPITSAADRIWETIEASQETIEPCHLRYFGWLGSLPNLQWILNLHSKRQGLKQENPSDDNKAFFFPVLEDFSNLEQHEGFLSEDGEVETFSAGAHKTPGGTPLWGAYAYWISKTGYEILLDQLRQDVGAILWKGKRMRHYVVKPIDKVMPRQIMSVTGRNAIHVTIQPAFFRAPMLTSKIHSQWDPDFCNSTQYQLHKTGLTWDDLWLTEVERKVVRHYVETEEWISQQSRTDEAGIVDGQDADLRGA